MWPYTAIFLCLWHVTEHGRNNFVLRLMMLAILKDLASIMYNKTRPLGHTATTWVIQKLQHLERTYPRAVEFWEYVNLQWLPKVHMWVVGYRNMPYAGQDTNAAIELYHNYMKSILKVEKSRMTSIRVDWCIHDLTGDVYTHYWYSSLTKIHGFVENQKEHSITVSTLVLTWEIPDSNVSLLSANGGPAFVTFTTSRHVQYAIYNHLLFATCTCVHS